MRAFGRHALLFWLQLTAAVTFSHSVHASENSGAGPLVPTGPPADGTYRTLQEIWDKLELLQTENAELRVLSEEIQQQNDSLRDQLNGMEQLVEIAVTASGGTPWQTGTIVQSIDRNVFDIINAPSGTPMAAYALSSPETPAGVAASLRYAPFDGEVWSDTVVNNDENVYFTSITLMSAPDGSPALVGSQRHLLAPSGIIQYYSRQVVVPTVQWVVEPIAVSPNVINQSTPFPLRMAFSTLSGEPIVAFFPSDSASSRDLNLFQRSDGIWSDVTPSAASDLWWLGSLTAMPGGDFALLATEDVNPADDEKYPVFVRYREESDTWSYERVLLPEDSFGRHLHDGLAMVLDGVGEERVLIGSRETLGTPVFSHPRYWEPGNLDSVNRAVTERPFLEMEYFGEGQHYDIAALGAGRIGIAALDETDGSLWFAVRDAGGNWFTEKVLDSGVKTAPIRLFLTPAGLPAIGYLAEVGDRTDLKWAYALINRP